MLIGIDFDNTIVCYDRLFHALALEAGLIPNDLPATKRDVAEYLRSTGRERDWTELQGRAYGPEIHRAELFPGVLEFLREAQARGVKAVIISHKTAHAMAGPPHDLRECAREFLRRRGFFDSSSGLSEAQVFFEPTKREKVARIGSEGCTHFIDDLADVLDDPEFPPNVRKLHFGAVAASTPNAGRDSLKCWRGAWDALSAMRNEQPQPARECVERLLRIAGFSPDYESVSPLAGGRNNRTYRVTTGDGSRVLLKWYFRHPDDPRDRLNAEFMFATYCRRFGIEAAPAPMARDDEAALGIYEYCERAETAPTQLRHSHLEQALDFLRRLQRDRASPEAQALPPASEACLTHDDHVRGVERRVKRLAQAAAEEAMPSAFRDFVLQRLRPRWDLVSERLRCALELRPQASWELCVSPSDFGFHNALEAPDGRIRFFDFEYAGWDDPAKLLCDFFCQVAVPVPLEFAPWFANAFLVEFANPSQCAARAEVCFAAYRIKWCAIVLNEFLPAGSARRAFGHVVASPERLAAQLSKAEAMLDRLEADGERRIFTAASSERAS